MNFECFSYIFLFSALGFIHKIVNEVTAPAFGRFPTLPNGEQRYSGASPNEQTNRSILLFYNLLVWSEICVLNMIHLPKLNERVLGRFSSFLFLR